MVVAEAVEQAVDGEEAQLRRAVAAVLGEGPLHTDGDVADATGLTGRERENIGWCVDAEEPGVERAQVGVIGEQEGQRRARPDGERVPATTQQGTKSRTPNRLSLRGVSYKLGAADSHPHRNRGEQGLWGARHTPRGHGASRGAARCSLSAGLGAALLGGNELALAANRWFLVMLAAAHL